MGLGVLKRDSCIHKAFIFRKTRISGMTGAILLTGSFLLTGMLLPVRMIRAEENGNNSETVAQEEKYQGEEIQEIYPVYYDEWEGRSEDIIELEGDEEEYEVLPGDCLWDISEKLWGDGRWYGRLAADNDELIEDPNLIYPGMTLRSVQKGYIHRRQTQYAGMKTGDYSIDTPGNWTVGTISSGGASANLVMSGEGFNKILCLVQDKKSETVLTTNDWEECARKIREYAEKYYGENVSDLTFEHYRTGQGEEIYLYSFLWEMGLPDYPELGKVRIRACMGLKLTEHIQAEFLGFASKYDIHGGVRYTTASFEEHVEDYDPETFTVNDSNMAILPEAGWELEGMYDPFSWLDEFFGAMLREVAGIEPEPENAREGLIEQISRPGGRKS